MADKTEATEILRTFLAEEKAGRGGKFWQMNWLYVEPVAPKAASLLPPEEAERVFFNILQRNDAPPAVPQAALPLLLAAYEALLAKRERGGFRARWHIPTFVFGFTQDATTPGKLRDAATLKARLKLVTHLAKFAHLPGMRAKRTGFQPFVDQAGHILDALRLIGFRLDYGRGENENYDYANLSYWGLVLTVLSSRDHRTALLGEMLDPALDLPRREEVIGILHEFVQSVLPDVGEDETEFRALADHLAARERERIGETESAAIARQLGLPFQDGEDWEVSVRAPVMGHATWFNSPGIYLRFRPHPDDEWRVTLTAGDHEYTDWKGRDMTPAGDLPRLARLAEFPAWLRGIGESHGLVFDFAKADIRCGRKRSAAKLIQRWIEGGD